MQRIQWKDEYSVGVPELDEQHKGLVALINRLSEEGHRPRVVADTLKAQTFRDLVGNAADARRHDVGDRIPHVVGVIDYAFGNFELVATEIADLQPADAPEPSTSLAAGPEHLVIASYNVENLDPQVEAADRVGGTSDIDDDVGDGRFQRIARHIVVHLGQPDIVAVQEIQDNDGAEMTDVVAADRTFSVLIDAIEQEGGSRYGFIDRPPVDDAEGGQPGGNIRVGFLFKPERVQVDEARIVRIDDPAFSGSRRPKVVPFRFNGRDVLIVNVHLTSKGGSDPLFGSVQPPANGGEPQRIRQAAAIRGFLRRLPADPDRRLVVVGDHNAFQFETPLLILTEGGEPQLVNLTNRLPLAERRSYVFGKRTGARSSLGRSRQRRWRGIRGPASEQRHRRCCQRSRSAHRPDPPPSAIMDQCSKRSSHRHDTSFHHARYSDTGRQA